MSNAQILVFVALFCMMYSFGASAGLAPKLNIKTRGNKNKLKNATMASKKDWQFTQQL
jgi:hypothetical protein